jgi:hypothetical protein
MGEKGIAKSIASYKVKRHENGENNTKPWNISLHLLGLLIICVNPVEW